MLTGLGTWVMLGQQQQQQQQQQQGHQQQEEQPLGKPSMPQ
jgi:hypothetical protein